MHYRSGIQDPPQENGLAYAALGLLSFGPSKERNPVWERLVDETRERLDKLFEPKRLRQPLADLQHCQSRVPFQPRTLQKRRNWPTNK